MSLTIGADPEFFVMDSKTSEIIPIMGLLGGTKDNPISISGKPGYAVQEDNVMAEYNIPPCSDPYTFADCIVAGREFALRRIRKHRPYATLYTSPCYLFSEQALDHDQARMFGCSKDYDGYMGENMALPRVDPEALYVQGRGGWRFAGGHVHIGYLNAIDYEIPPHVFATLCDLFLSVPMIAHGYDPQETRRRFYGTPGRYRPTKYGIEYRTLSNFWTYSSRTALHVGMAVMNLGNLLERGEDEVRRVYNDFPWEAIRQAIASEDVSTCADLRRYASGQGMGMI